MLETFRDRIVESRVTVQYIRPPPVSELMASAARATGSSYTLRVHSLMLSLSVVTISPRRRYNVCSKISRTRNFSCLFDKTKNVDNDSTIDCMFHAARIVTLLSLRKTAINWKD